VTSATAQLGTVVITGAASGMGLATAQLFSTRGWRVVALDASGAHPTDQETATDPDLQGSIIACTVDVRDRTAVTQALAKAVGEGTVQAVVNAAGIYPPSTLETFTEDLYRNVFDVNVLGILNVTAACLPYMQPGSSIVNFSSVDAFTVSPGQLIYGASKAAVVMLTKATAVELAPRGIRVNGVAPGWVETPGNAATGRMEAAAAGIPIGRVAQPSEIAEWVWILTGSGVAGFVDGETIVISGGDVMR
jgi:3-oxoacyl-[acyl-carrier protein] reductase